MLSVRRSVAATTALFVIATAFALIGHAASAPPAGAAPTGYVTLSDGTSIAVNVRMPTSYEPGKKYPTIFEMSGYDGGSADGGTLMNDFGLVPVAEQVPGGSPLPTDDSRQLTDLFNGEYVTVHTSVRGTGCSSGEFDIFSWRSALDGKEIIDGWIAEQSWSNGNVGILGHSYGGITGFMVAATQPQHLRAISVSGLIDDLYRGLVYPGGVTNYGFPLLWTLGVRPAYDIAGGLLPGIVRPEGADDAANRQEQCALNTLGKSRTITNDPVLQGLADTDNDWYRARSLLTYADQIKVPVHMVGAYQDEQTGPRGPARLYEAITKVSKRLLLTNGDHNTETSADYGSEPIRQDRKAWLDHWIRGVNGGFGTTQQAKKSATVFFDMHADGNGKLVPGGRKDAKNFPLPDTKWTDWYLHGDGSLSTSKPGAPEPSRGYVSGTKRQAWSYQAGGDVGPPITTAEGPDELSYRSAPVTSQHRDRRSDHGHALRAEHRARHRVLRAAHRRGPGREPHVPPAWVAAGEPPCRRRRGEPEDGRRTHLPAAPPAHQPDEHHAAPDLRVLDRGLPGRACLPTRPPHPGEGARAAVRRLVLRLRASERARHQHDPLRAEHAVEDPAAGRAAHRCRARARAGMRRAGGGPMHRRPGRARRRAGAAAERPDAPHAAAGDPAAGDVAALDAPGRPPRPTLIARQEQIVRPPRAAATTITSWRQPNEPDSAGSPNAGLTSGRQSTRSSTPGSWAISASRSTAARG